MRVGDDASTPYVGATPEAPLAVDEIADIRVPGGKIPTPISREPVAETSVWSSSPIGGLGFRPAIGGVLVVTSIVVRLAGRLLWGRRRFRF